MACNDNDIDELLRILELGSKKDLDVDAPDVSGKTVSSLHPYILKPSFCIYHVRTYLD